ncbi:TylF/MycF/NovP-related O-methyltransferase [Nocardioides convexus]|uniref:TylF/MycF/NovP-related O-methyltransferase n=1 Tax=Nocardioides convexus TaxID=2712224 RepID=UPI002418B228|nr:TylF/MycF/NovP-related O-methyltransferase [Nocardioides convexus]
MRELYLDLMKRTLTGALMEDNDSILGGVRTAGSPSLKKKAANAAGSLAQRFGFEIAYKKPYDPALRETGSDWPARSESMIGLKRMQNIQDAISAIIEDDVPGDLIETGVWRGGACIFMRANLKAWGDTKRTVWLADSFQGLPAPNVKDFPADQGDTFYLQTGLSVGEAAVRHNFERYGLLDDQVKFLVGWFKDTLPTAPAEQYALIRLDGDLYESTIQALDALYPKARRSAASASSTTTARCPTRPAGRCTTTASSTASPTRSSTWTATAPTGARPPDGTCRNPRLPGDSYGS